MWKPSLAPAAAWLVAGVALAQGVDEQKRVTPQGAGDVVERTTCIKSTGNDERDRAAARMMGYGELSRAGEFVLVEGREWQLNELLKSSVHRTSIATVVDIGETGWKKKSEGGHMQMCVSVVGRVRTKE